MNGWAFLVGRGRSKGYRTVLAPDFLVARNLHSLLSASASGDSGRQEVEIDKDDVGHMSLTYRTEQLRSGDLDDSDSDRDDELVLDEHGRPLELLYGVVSRHHPPSGVDERDLQRAREEAFGSYRRFLAEEDTFRVDVSSSFPLHGFGVPTARSDVDFPAADHLGAAEVARPAAEVAGLSDGGAARGAVGSPPTKARRRKIGSDGAAVIAGAALVALLVLWWALPDRDMDVDVTVRPGNEASCAELRTLVGTITAKEPGRVVYHWELQKEFGHGDREFKAAGEQNVEEDVPREPGGRLVQRGTYSLVIDQPEELRQTVVVDCKE